MARLVNRGVGDIVQITMDGRLVSVSAIFGAVMSFQHVHNPELRFRDRIKHSQALSL